MNIFAMGQKDINHNMQTYFADLPFRAFKCDKN